MEKRKGQGHDRGLKLFDLEGYEQPVALPGAKKIKEKLNIEYKQAHLEWELGHQTTTRLNRLAQQNGTTLNLVLQTIWGIQLMKYNNSEDVVFGAVVSGRPAAIEGIEKMVGLFINTVPVRVTATAERGGGFLRILKNLHAKTAKTNAYEYQSLAELQARSPLKGQLFDHIMVFENYPITEEIKQATKKQGSPFKVTVTEAPEHTNYPFNIIIAPGKSISIKYAENAVVYESMYVENTRHHFNELIRQVTANPHLHPDEIQL
ncbi:MAG: hypothetical protein GY765_43720, partial [bacterium]|nr:hypothetical protein [bacterium]